MQIKSLVTALIVGLFLSAVINAQDRSSQAFVNSLGMKMIFVEGKAFDARTPSLWQRSQAISAGKPSSHMFALNRPHVLFPVELDDYYMAQFPVTNGMYRRFVDQTGHRTPAGRLQDFCWFRRDGSPWDMDDFSGDDLPVTAVNNIDIDAFCAWLSKTEDRTYRPAGHHEFEYASRAGTNTRYWWGDYPDARYMNHGVSRIGHPTPVGFYPANPWGFHDTHGNVWQYCADGGRLAAMGGAFNCAQRMTGADAFVNHAEGPNIITLLSTGFRLACDAAEGRKRPGDLTEATIVPAGGSGPAFAELDITVGERIELGALTSNSVVFMVTRDGTWLLDQRRSTDRGKTWTNCAPIPPARCQLRDGTILAIVENRMGFDHLKGESSFSVQTSTDDWQTVETVEAQVYVPLADWFLPVRGLVELEDGRLLATLYGRMDGDRVWEESPMAAELAIPWIKTRVIVIESSDRGKSWRYLSTLSYNPQLGTEGQNEADLIQLPDGHLFAAMRTGIHGDRDLHGREHMDQPLLVAWSADGGRSWSDPQRIYVDGKLITGIYPRILTTKDGVLAVLRCRPDGSVVFSPDGGGAFWSDEMVYYEGLIARDVPYHAGMQDMALIGPHTILVVDVVNPSGFPPTTGWRAQGVPIKVRKKK